ncbi:MAG TPA: galactose oxidase-like domain-containing protein [Thermoleophilaceae bacterium]
MRQGSLAGVVVGVLLMVAAPAYAHEQLAPKLGAAAPTLNASEVSDPAQGGNFGDPFEEPTIGGKLTGAKCITDENDVTICKPAAGSVTVLANGKVLYWNALEGTERVKASIVAEYGAVALNDQTRLLDLSTSPFKWTVPAPSDAGANPDGNDNEDIIPGGNSEKNNDGALFCSDLTFLPDGRVLATGGTSYYLEPEVGNTGLGVSELEGLKNARIYDPRTNTWSQTGSMKYGRWYPTMVEQGNGKIFVASGVTKLLKPVYPDHPLDSGRNVAQTETFDGSTGKWTYNGTSADRSLPLYPRLHLLPNGHIFYNAEGQSFNPFGQAYDEALWNYQASYDPEAHTWKQLGIPGLPSGSSLSDLAAFDFGNPVGDVANFGLPGGGRSTTLPGFRGSTFSIMMPLKAPYTKASFLTAGGVLNPPSPGSYVTTSDSRISTVDTTAGDAVSTHPTGDLSRPRWYSTGVLLPTGEVIAFSGSDRDSVDAPGTEFPIEQAEMFDPKTESWTPMATAHRPRTYHNTAVLLPDGRVLVGGHAPISTLYLRDTTLPGGFAPNDGRDPSFELYKPPYLFRGDRPSITGTSGGGYGDSLHVSVNVPSSDIDSVVMVRNPTLTHLIDGEQRNVDLPVLSRSGNSLTVAMPPNGNVAPPGPYMLFVNRKSSKGLVPSVSKQLMLSR